MQWLASICVRRPVFATVLILAIVVVGIVGYRKLGVDRFPNVDFPIVTVVTTLPGAAPEEVETEVTDKIEEAVNTISGIDELRSISTEGVSQVIVSFELEKDIDVAAQEVREHVSHRACPSCPRGRRARSSASSIPTRRRCSSSRWRRTRPIREVTELADNEVRRRSRTSSGVGQVTIIGGRKRQIKVVRRSGAAARRRAHAPSTCSARSSPQNVTHAGRRRRHRARSASPSG